MKNILITLCARGGSKGVPGKNVKKLNGKPLIYYSLLIAEKFASRSEFNTIIILSTDSSSIKQTVGEFNFQHVLCDYDRPSYLATDCIGKIGAIKDVKEFVEKKDKIEFDYILDLDITSPLRTVSDLDAAFAMILKDDNALNLFSVSKANRNPYFNMVEIGNNGYYCLCKNGAFLTRQSAPDVFDMNASFYIYTKKFFQLNLTKAITTNSLVYLVPHLCFDLDHPIDFEFMEFLIKYNKLDFNFLK